MKLFERRTTRPMRSAGPEDVHIALVASVRGQWVDVQDLIWDAMEFVTRAAEVLEGEQSDLADAMADYFATERRQLAAFRRGMTGGDWAEWLAMTGASGGDAFWPR